MCYAGAKTDTFKELSELLCLNDLTEEDALYLFQGYADSLQNLGSYAFVNVANRVFVNSKTAEVKEEFNQKLKKHFESESVPLDFSNQEESAKVINEWVAEQTEDKIQDILKAESIDSRTLMVLVNAIYLIAEWETKFSKESTREAEFYLKDGNVKMVQMMKKSRQYFNLKINPSGLKASSLQMPYAGNKMAMTIILPDEDTDIDDVEANLDHDVLKEVLKTDNSSSYINLYMPRFKVEFEKEVSIFNLQVKIY